MPKAFDRDLRIRIVNAYNDGEGSDRCASCRCRDLRPRACRSPDARHLGVEH